MKINVNNARKLHAEIESIESKARVRLANQANILDVVSDIEEMLEPLLFKKLWIGTRFDIDPNAQTFPASYNGSPESTQVEVERFPTGWFVTGIKRTYCRSKMFRWKNIGRSMTHIEDTLKSKYQ